MESPLSLLIPFSGEILFYRERRDMASKKKELKVIGRHTPSSGQLLRVLEIVLKGKATCTAKSPSN